MEFPDKMFLRATPYIQRKLEMLRMSHDSVYAFDSLLLAPP